MSQRHARRACIRERVRAPGQHCTHAYVRTLGVHSRRSDANEPAISSHWSSQKTRETRGARAWKLVVVPIRRNRVFNRRRRNRWMKRRPGGRLDNRGTSSHWDTSVDLFDRSRVSSHVSHGSDALPSSSRRRITRKRLRDTSEIFRDA